jgi:oxygen-independent coproporphyrinogen-3 oxidase
MCDGEVRPDALGRAHGARPGWWADAVAVLAPMQADGLVEVRGGLVRLTARGAPLARVVAAAFDQYLAGSHARHSVAV